MPRNSGFSHCKRKQETGAAIGRPKTRQAKQPKRCRDEDLKMLLDDDYWPILDAVLAKDPILVALISQYIHNNRSTYRPMAGSETPMQYFRRHQMPMVNAIHILTTVGHQQDAVTPWKVMKSIAALKEKTRRVQYEVGVKEKQFIHRGLLKHTLQRLQDLKPPTDTNVSPHIAKNCSDQLNVWRGATKRRAKRETERVGDDGKKVKVESNTLLMMVDFPVDHDTYHMTGEDAEWIKENGPYTEDYREIYAHLNWEKCQEELYETVDEFTAQLVQKFGFTDSDSETELQLEHMFLLMSRPDHNPGDSCN